MEKGKGEDMEENLSPTSKNNKESFGERYLEDGNLTRVIVIVTESG